MYYEITVTSCSRNSQNRTSIPENSNSGKNKASIFLQCSPPSPHKKNIYQYLQCYEEIHSVKFPFRQFGPPKVGVNHCQKILKRKDKFILGFWNAPDKKKSWKTIFVLTLSDIIAQLSIHRKSWMTSSSALLTKKLIMWTLVLVFGFCARTY